VLLLGFDSSLLFDNGLLDGLFKGLETVFSYPSFGLIQFGKLEALYKDLLVQMGFSPDVTMAEFYRSTRTICDIYVTNLTNKQSECWNANTHPDVPLSFALAVSSALPMVVTLPIIAGVAYADGGIVQNVPIGNDYDPRETMAMMIDIEPRG
jgi:predicted acylesterase/phospholipase RssA